MGRAKRPHAFASSFPFVHDAKETCPFDNLEKFGNEKPVLQYGGKADWTLKVFPNKYPAFMSGFADCPVMLPKGPYNTMEGRGFHEVFVLRDHYKQPAELPVARLHELVHAYAERFRMLKEEGCVNYISIFHNHGRSAGASLTHPHSQLIAIPVIPPDISRSLEGSDRFFAGERKCAHCTMIEYERKEKSRIIFENSSMVVFAPFVSRSAFEMRIFPKEHSPHFETMSDREERSLAEALKTALHALNKGLKNPAYNYFIHTAPTRDHSHGYYHWHLEIVPKTQVWAGFEIGTGIEISTIGPESAAKFLRSFV